jgi:hypothetical protein
MASRRSRRGSFGLQPRVVPNVTAQIVALAREYVAKRDSLIMDAWRNGGTFEGKKATDEMVLAYWKERGKDLDKNDPEYEQSQDQIMQLTYGIEQSKADVKHVQGKLSDEAYAQFFLRWAKKVPANSEFYRTLQKDAAQLIESAKAKARANADKAKTEAFNSFVKTTTTKDIAIGDAMTAALSDLSKQTGLSITGNGEELLSLLTKNVHDNPAEYRQLLDTIRAGDPNWNGQLTPDYFSGHIQSASHGYDLIADRAAKAGYVSAYAGATKGEASMSEWGQNLKVWPVAQQYTQAENAFLRVYNDPAASQAEITSAANAFSGRIDNMLAHDQGMDAGTRAMLTADSKRLLGQDGGDAPSFGTSMLGRQGVDPNTTARLSMYHQLAEAQRTDPVNWTYGPVDAKGNYDPTGIGPIGIVPAASVPAGSQGVLIPGRDGKAVMAMLVPHSVYATDPADPRSSPVLAGYQLTYQVGGKTVELWGYKDASNQSHWSVQSPLTPGSVTTRNEKGDIYVQAPQSGMADPIARAQAYDQQYGTHLADQLRAQRAAGLPLGNTSATVDSFDPASKKKTGTFEISFKDGLFSATRTTPQYDTPSLTKDSKEVGSTTTPFTLEQYDSTNAARSAFSQSALHAGDIPGVTYSSPIQASVQAAGSTQTVDQVARYAGDPAFQQMFLAQTMQTLGTTNPYDPRIAEAWKTITTPTRQLPTDFPSDAARAAARSDLKYPGVNDIPYDIAPSVTFGPSGELRLPGMPSYLQPSLPSNSMTDRTDSSLFSGVNTMLAGSTQSFVPPQTQPAPVVTPTSPSPSGTFAPTPPTYVKPTPAPTPTPTNVKPTVAPPPPAPYDITKDYHAGAR